MLKLKMMRRLLTAFCLMIWAAAFAAAQGDRIEPGSRVGKITLGMTRQSVHKTLGSPDGTFQFPAGVHGDYWTSSTRGESLQISYSAGRVFQIEVTSDSFSTAHGLTTRSSLAQIQKSYPRLRKTAYFRDNTFGTAVNYYEATRQGITFVFVNPDSTTPAGNFKPYSIIIHEPGRHAVTPTMQTRTATGSSPDARWPIFRMAERKERDRE
ncbi:MAG TPA: hypothetical protein VF735_11290 [Pyrinomonadaceae bacterium]|jgi:hypothetical protein